MLHTKSTHSPAQATQHLLDEAGLAIYPTEDLQVWSVYDARTGDWIAPYFSPSAAEDAALDMALEQVTGTPGNTYH